MKEMMGEHLFNTGKKLLHLKHRYEVGVRMQCVKVAYNLKSKNLRDYAFNHASTYLCF